MVCELDLGTKSTENFQISPILPTQAVVAVAVSESVAWERRGVLGVLEDGAEHSVENVQDLSWGSSAAMARSVESRDGDSRDEGRELRFIFSDDKQRRKPQR